jgi:uncharacterized lipoprotein YmbA
MSLYKHYIFKPMMIPIRIAVIFALLMGISACGGALIAQPDFYLLMPEKGDESWRLQKPLQLALSKVELPKYLDSSRIVTARNTYRLKQAAGHLWAESLADNIERVMGMNLIQRLGLKRVYQYPAKRDADWVLTLHFEHLMGNLETNAHIELQAYWSLQRAKTVVHESRFSVKRALIGPSYDDFVKALSQELGRLSDEIALAIVKQQ